MAIKYYDDFKLGNYKLSDFGGVLINNGDWKINIAPSREYTTETMPFKDGELYFGSRLNPRTINLKMYFNKEVDLPRLSSWLASDNQQTFSYVGDNKEIDVVYDGMLELEAYEDNGFKGIMDISFVAHNPYYRVINEGKLVFDNPKTLTYRFKSNGNVESYPIIKITPNGTQSRISFSWNGKMNILTNVDKDIYLDCEQEELYEIINGIKTIVPSKYDSNFYMEFPNTKPFVDNTFQIIKGNVNKVEINLNSRIR